MVLFLLLYNKRAHFPQSINTLGRGWGLVYVNIQNGDDFF